MPIETEEIRTVLDESLTRAETAFLEDKTPRVPSVFADSCDVVFGSKTQAYREVLVGCLLARIHDKATDIRLPYVKLGANAFSGRSLDERVVNPLLREKRVPSSKGPYLSVFRRSVKFDDSTGTGLKDKSGYGAFLALLSMIEEEEDDSGLLALLDYVMHRFVLLREEAKVDLIAFDRISLTQYKELIKGLLQMPSGGLFPVVLVLSMVETMNHVFSLSWEVEHQGINVADMAAGVPGDITITQNGSPLLSIEVTERPVNDSRVQGTFRDKISAMGVLDYGFLVHLETIGHEAREQAEKYFAQGYDVNFVDINEWLSNTLFTVGRKGRKFCQDRLIQHLGQDQVPRVLKVAWNEEMEKLIT
ncbi:MAG: restriction endonuclease, SacI family [Anaerolineae bacterium]